MSKRPITTFCLALSWDLKRISSTDIVERRIEAFGKICSLSVFTWIMGLSFNGVDTNLMLGLIPVPIFSYIIPNSTGPIRVFGDKRGCSIVCFNLCWFIFKLGEEKTNDDR